MVIRIQTILGLDTFINVLVDELNKLKDKQVNDILNYKLDDIIPESEDIYFENYVELETRSIYLKVIMVLYVKSQVSYEVNSI